MFCPTCADDLQTENSIGGSIDYWVLKLDTAGNIQWQKTVGTAENDLLNSIRQTTDGGYILGGSSDSDTSVAYEDYDYFTTVRLLLKENQLITRCII